MAQNKPGWVLITGAGSGIGRETAHCFSQAGHPVFLLGRTEKKLQQVARELNSQSHILACDLTQASAVKESVEKVRQTLAASQGSLETLVNNAGIIERREFSESDDQMWELNFHANLLGPVRITRELIPLLKDRTGSIVNLASTLGQKPVPNTSVYSAMKAATINWTQCLALELAARGIRVNAVSPGIVETPIHGLEALDNADEVKATLHSMQPLKRMGRPEEIAKAIYFLASQNSSWTTGATLTVDGGIQLA